MIETGFIQQIIELRLSTSEVYEIFIDSVLHESLVHIPCAIDPRRGGRFAIGMVIHGTFIDLVPGRRIIQSWRMECNGWPLEHFSNADLTLLSTPHGSTLHLYQTHVPLSCMPYIEWAWREYYWQPLLRVRAKEQF